MTTIANTKENNAIVNALKKISETNWVGNTTQDTLDKCLSAINLQSSNSGWYQPIATRINGLTGMFMINKNGSIYWEARIIKEGEKYYNIEYLTNEAYNIFEIEYNKYMAQ